MAPWENWEPCNIKAKTMEPITITSKEKLPFPFDCYLVITSMKQKNEAQAKVELQDQNGNVIRTLTSAYARITTCT